MAKPVSVKIDGLHETEQALFGLAKATAKNVGRKSLRAGAGPILDDYLELVPRDTGNLAESAGISSKLTRRQARANRKSSDRADVEMFVGPGSDPAAVQQEFGNDSHPAQPALTPAFEKNKGRSLQIIAQSLGVEVKKSAERQARKLARLAGKND